MSCGDDKVKKLDKQYFVYNSLAFYFSYDSIYFPSGIILVLDIILLATNCKKF